MRWKDLKLGGKFTASFGIVILLLSVVATWSINGIHGIVGNAEEVIDGNKLRTNINEKYVQHLQWTLALNDFLTNDAVTNLHVQTDYHQCDFGKWYYGEGRKKAEKLAPNLKPILADMEEPHKHLHESAVDIEQVFEQANYEFSLNLQHNMTQHIEWSSKIKDALLAKSNSLDLQTDHSKCDFGIWLKSNEVKEAKKHNPDFADFLRNVEPIHEQLHESAIQINNYMRRGQYNQALNYYNRVTLPAMEKTLIEIQDMIDNNNEKLAGMKKAQNIYQKETQTHLATLSKLFNTMIAKTQEDMITDEAMLSNAESTRSGVIWFSIIAILFAILLAYIIAVGIIKPIRKGVALAGAISDGDLTADVDIDQNDEIGQLAKALQNMKDKLKSIIGEIIEGSNQIAIASEQLSSSSSEQAASTEEVSSSMEQMMANIQQNSENALKTETIANKAAKEIEIGYNSVSQTVQSMQDIAENITVIEEIAEKTDLLAINAAIEAARAGEHGKGFAVVAMEVRKLAERSQQAASEINHVSKSSVSVAEETGTKMGEIVPEIKKTSALVQEIAASSHEQNTGAGQVNNALQQLNQTNQSTAANAEELASQAEVLKSAVGFFTVGSKVAETTTQRTKASNTVVKTNGNTNATNTPKEYISLNDMDMNFEAY